MNQSITVTICSGTTCHVMGGGELLLLEEHIPLRWKGKILVEGSPCLGFCKDKVYGKAPYDKKNEKILRAATITAVIDKIAEKLGEQ